MIFIDACKNTEVILAKPLFFLHSIYFSGKYGRKCSAFSGIQIGERTTYLIMDEYIGRLKKS
jgi:hypothetical protein